MNKMPADELAGFKADIKVAFIAAGILLISLIIWLRTGPPVTLLNEPCAPSKPTYVDGVKVGCVNDEATNDRWYPGIRE